MGAGEGTHQHFTTNTIENLEHNRSSRHFYCYKIVLSVLQAQWRLRRTESTVPLVGEELPGRTVDSRWEGRRFRNWLLVPEVQSWYLSCMTHSGGSVTLVGNLHLILVKCKQSCFPPCLLYTTLHIVRK
jgi:hypothetical protein